MPRAGYEGQKTCAGCLAFCFSHWQLMDSDIPYEEEFAKNAAPVQRVKYLICKRSTHNNNKTIL